MATEYATCNVALSPLKLSTRNQTKQKSKNVKTDFSKQPCKEIVIFCV